MFSQGMHSIVGSMGMLALLPGPGVLHGTGSGWWPLASLASLCLVVAVCAGTICLRLKRRQLLLTNDTQSRLRLAREETAFLRRRLHGFDNILDRILVETDSTGQILFLAGPWSTLGPGSADPMPHPRTIEEWIHPADRAAFADFSGALLAGHQVAEQEFRLQDSVGRCVVFRCVGSPTLEDGKTAATGLRLALSPRDDAAQVQEARQEKARTEEVLTLVLRSFTERGEGQLEQALLQALDPVARLVGADIVLLVRCDGPGVDLETALVWRQEGFCLPADPQLGERLLETGMLREALNEGRILHLDGPALQERDASAGTRLLEDFGLCGLAIFPVESGADHDEILILAGQDPAIRWDDNNLGTMQVLVSHYAAAHRREANHRLLETAHRKFETIVDFLPDATFVINRGGEVVTWNRAMEELTGVGKEEILGQGNCAHALPFYGKRIPTLINHFGNADLEEWRQLYDFVEVDGHTMYAECSVPSLNNGSGAILWSTATALHDEAGEVIGAIQSLRDVTYRKKGEQVLRNSEERHRLLVEAMNDGMGVASSTGIITYANDSLCQMLRIEKGQILGASILSLFPALRDLGPLETWEGWNLRPGEAIELDVPRADGTSFPARISPAPLRDQNQNFAGGFAIISDMTHIRQAEAHIMQLNQNLEQRVADGTRELREANEALRRSEARYRRIIESLKEGYIFYSQDMERRFTYLSPSFSHLTGYRKPDQLCAGLRRDLRRPENHEAWSMARQSLQGFRQPPFDLHVTCHDGHQCIMEILEVPIFNDAGDVISVEGIGRDVTEARRNLQLIREAQAQLVEQEKMAALGSLVTGLSHEINTPVGIGVTAASHLAEEMAHHLKLYHQNALTRERFESFLEDCRESSSLIATNLNRAVDLLQNFKQAATDQAAPVNRVFNLKEYLEDVLRSFSPRLRNTGFHIHVDCPDDLEMQCDPGSLYQILSNLVMNSLNHGFEGMLVGQINISARVEEDGLVLEYGDNGNGMKRKDLARIYEPFFTTKRGRGGTGLGLHIVYSNVTRNLGGNITCASKPGRGTGFTITVPLLAEVGHG